MFLWIFDIQNLCQISCFFVSGLKTNPTTLKHWLFEFPLQRAFLREQKSRHQEGYREQLLHLNVLPLLCCLLAKQGPLCQVDVTRGTFCATYPQNLSIILEVKKLKPQKRILRFQSTTHGIITEHGPSVSWSRGSKTEVLLPRSYIRGSDPSIKRIPLWNKKRTVPRTGIRASSTDYQFLEVYSAPSNQTLLDRPADVLRANRVCRDYTDS